VYCAIDFGTSNSGIALPTGSDPDAALRLLEIEPGHPTMPTAVFYGVEGLAPHEPPRRLYGRAAVAAYVAGTEGRLMRSMKSILGSSLLEQRTDLGAGHAVGYREVVSGYLQHLKRCAETHLGTALDRAVLGRPVFFVDGDAARDTAAQRALEAAARTVGFAEVHFQYEPIAAALDYERRATREQLVLVADIGGGTSDFSLVRVGPARRAHVERRDDILANHGVHVAGTDFDRLIELACLLPTLGYKSRGPARPGKSAHEVPSAVYFDLATWHLINTVYAPRRVAELARMRSFYARTDLHARLMRVVEQRLGHGLAAMAERMKIEVADLAEGAAVAQALDVVEAGLAVTLTQAQAASAVGDDMERIVAAAREALRQAGTPASAVDVLYLTGGSTGLAPLAQRLAAVCADAEVVRGDRFASVATGLGLHAQRLFQPGS
jgi:hypothetical chaperone protein